MERIVLSEQDRILVVVPHPDDESIGCGGVLAKYGKQADILLVTDGRKGHEGELSDDECVLIRQREFENAMALVHPKNLIRLDIPDTEVEYYEKRIAKYDISYYKYIFIPDEGHQDHTALNRIFKKMYRKQCDVSKTKMYEYEVWTPLRYADIVVDITDVMDIKLKMVCTYNSQLKLYDYVELFTGLNMYRGAAAHMRYAEAYQSISINHKRKKQWAKMKRDYKKIKRDLKIIKHKLKVLAVKIMKLGKR